MGPFHLSKNNIQDLTNDVPQHNIKFQIISNSESSVCRICLDPCENISYCNCKGSSMIHQQCLYQYILKGHGNMISRTRCQICKNKFKLQMINKCSFSCSNGVKQLKSNLVSSIFLLLFCIITIVANISILYVYINDLLKPDLQTILSAIGISMMFILVLILIKWFFQTFWVRSIVFNKILPIKTQNNIRNFSNININNNSHNETLQNM